MPTPATLVLDEPGRRAACRRRPESKGNCLFAGASSSTRAIAKRTDPAAAATSTCTQLASPEARETLRQALANIRSLQPIIPVHAPRRPSHSRRWLRCFPLHRPTFPDQHPLYPDPRISRMYLCVVASTIVSRVHSSSQVEGRLRPNETYVSRFGLVLTSMARGWLPLAPSGTRTSRSWGRPGKRFLHPELRSLSRRRRQGQRTVCSGTQAQPADLTQLAKKTRSVSVRAGR